MADHDERRAVRRAAGAAAERPAFLAWTLARFQASEPLDDAGLARWLGTEPERLPWLALCRRPRPTAFGADVRAIAERCGVAPSRLAALIRQVDALTALDAVAQDAGVLAAAREQEEPDQGEPPEDRA